MTDYMKRKNKDIKAKDCCKVTPDCFSQLSLDKRSKLVADHYLHKRRHLSVELLRYVHASLTPDFIRKVFSRLKSDRDRKRFFRSVKNIDPQVLNDHLSGYPVKKLYSAIKCLKLEDRKKISADILSKLSVDKIGFLLKDHFMTFGKLSDDFFAGRHFLVNSDYLKSVISLLPSKFIRSFFKKTGLYDLRKYAEATELDTMTLLLREIKGTVNICLVSSRGYFIKNGIRNKQNVLFVNKVLFENLDLLNMEIETKLHNIRLKQRKHITFLMQPFYNDLMLLARIINLPVRRMNKVIKFMKSRKTDLFLYNLVGSKNIGYLKKDISRKYSRTMQSIFDLVYDNFVTIYASDKKDDPVFRKKIKQTVSCRFIESFVEGVFKPEIPFFFQFESFLDNDGRTLLGYYRRDGVNAEVRPTIKNYANSYVRFRPRRNGFYDVFKLNSKGKIGDFVPVTYSLKNNKFQNMSSGFSVASYVKGCQKRPYPFRTYLTADSKLYFGKIGSEVIQTLISYLDGVAPVDVHVRKIDDIYCIDICLLNTRTGRMLLKKPLRSICLRTERPYFKDIIYDFQSAEFLNMTPKEFNNVLHLFKSEYFCAFYDKLIVEQKKRLYEKLNSKGEIALIDKIGEIKFSKDVEDISLAFGSDFDVDLDYGSGREPMGTGYARRKTDRVVDEIGDISDEKYFAARESARIDEFGFDFTSYPPELTFKIKMEVLGKIYESFPEDLKYYVKLHADEIDDLIQEKLYSINPKLLDGIKLEKDYIVRKDPVKRMFIDKLIKLFEDDLSYDKINEIISYLREPSIKISGDGDNFVMDEEIIKGVQDIVKGDYEKLVDSLSVIFLKKDL